MTLRLPLLAAALVLSAAGVASAETTHSSVSADGVTVVTTSSEDDGSTSAVTVDHKTGTVTVTDETGTHSVKVDALPAGIVPSMPDAMGTMDVAIDEDGNATITTDQGSVTVEGAVTEDEEEDADPSSEEMEDDAPIAE